MSGMRRDFMVLHGVGVAGDGERLDEAVVVDAVDDGDLEPQDVDHPLGGGLQHALEVLHAVDGGDDVVKAAKREHLARGSGFGHVHPPSAPLRGYGRRRATERTERTILCRCPPREPRAER